MTADPRYIAPTQGYFTTRDAIAPERLAAVEGVKPKGVVEVRRVMVGNEILMLHVFREKGLVDPVHKHLDHETVAYLISGRMRVVTEHAGLSWRPRAHHATFATRHRGTRAATCAPLVRTTHAQTHAFP